MRLKQGDLVKIDWIDAGGKGGWGEVEEFDPPHIVTVGHYIKTDKSGIYCATGIDGKDYKYVLGLDFIPHGCIKYVRKLK